MTAVEDALWALAWQVTTLTVLLAAARIATSLFPESRGSAKWLDVAIWSLAIVLVGLTIVGGVGLMGRGTVLLAVAAVSGAVWWGARRLTYTTAAVPEAADSETVSQANPAGAGWVWLVAAAVLAGHALCNGLLRFPTDWDTLMYHAPFIDHWIQHGTLEATQSARWSMPAASELLGLWFAAPFSGDFFIALNNVPVVILWALAIVNVARGLELAGWWPHLMALGCLAVQTTFKQTVDASNDLLVVAMFTAGLNYLLRFSREPSGRQALMCGVCLGILGSVKYFAMGYAVSLAAMFVLVWGQEGARPGRPRLKSLGLLCLVALATGGYWFARNTWMTGYPLYPIGTSQFADRLPYPHLHHSMLLFHLYPASLDLVLEAIWLRCGPVQLLALVVAPTLAIWMVMELVSRRHEQDNRYRILLTSLLGSLAVYLVTPMLVEDQPGTLNQLRWGYTTVRYGLTFLSCATIVLVWGVASLANNSGPWKSWAILVAVWGVLAYQVAQSWLGLETFDRWWPLAVAGVIVAVIIVGYVGAERLKLHSPQAIWSLLAVAMLLAAGGTAYLSHRWHAGFAAFYDGYRHTGIHEQLAQQPHRLFVLDERSFSYFGSRRQNYVVQPMRYYGVDQVVQQMEADNLDAVITRPEPPQVLTRYGGALQELLADPRFENHAIGQAGSIYLLKKR